MDGDTDYDYDINKHYQHVIASKQTKTDTEYVTFRDINYLFTFTEKLPHQDNVVITIGNRTQDTVADVIVTTEQRAL